MSIEEIIERKRDGRAHTAEELDALALGFVRGEIPDYQMSAWLMAAYVRGLNAEETVLLTDAMVRSGRVVDLSSVAGTVIDKHSTGGVGDSVTLVVAPLVAACGVPVAKMSGRGLGHTGGTIDKLESIPGMRVSMPVEEFVAQVREVGIAVVAQSPEVDPADAAMYALRDVTATVPSIPLIVSSIVSKKVACGAAGVLLDVKVGSGAFMKTETDARALAAELTRVGAELNLDIRCVLTDMDEPLGWAVGNVLEVVEAVSVLRGESPGRLADVSVALAARMLVMGGAAECIPAGEAAASRALADGSALATFRAWVAAQGGDPRVADDPGGVLPRPAVSEVLRAPSSGYLQGMDAEEVGRAACALGAGRDVKGAAIDPAAGVELHVRVGRPIEAGQAVATMHAATRERFVEGARRLSSALRIGPDRLEPSSLLVDA